MKLEKFKKYGVRNKKIICSVIGIVLIICGVLLLKSFAFFESKYDFNMIKGRVPDFAVGDVTLAFSIDGIKGNTLPSKDSYIAKSVTCANGVTAEWNNELWGLFNIDANGKEKISCNIDFGKSLYKVVKIGDYVSYTPSKTSYTIPKSLTGYSSDQTINPSELDVWRVIKKNEDGTIEMVSEYVSSTIVNFYGGTGYYNLVSALNTIAKQYETSGITSNSRYMGYNTNGTSLVTAAIGSLKAYKQGTKEFTDYWLSDVYIVDQTREWGDFRNMYGRFVDLNGSVSSTTFCAYYLVGEKYCERSYFTGLKLRPIVIINKNMFVINNFESTSPYKIN